MADIEICITLVNKTVFRFSGSDNYGLSRLRTGDPRSGN